MNKLLAFRRCHRRFGGCVLLLSVLFAGNVFGQATGTVTGRVFNQATNAYLEGATVEVQGTNRSVLTEKDGSFRLDGVPAGQQTVSVRYTGLDSASLPVSIVPGQSAFLEVGLGADIYQLSEITITGEREGSAMAITLQRNAPEMKTVMSSDHFGSMHTQNLGSFMQRLPGIATSEVEGEIVDVFIRGMAPDLNSVTLDGISLPSSSVKLASDRGADINKISADFISTVELIKSPTAEQDSHALGGQINLITKTPFDQKGRVVSYSAGGTFDLDEPNGIRPFASLMFSDVYGADQRLGLLLTSSWSEYTNSSSLTQQTWLAPTGTAPNYSGILTLWRKDFAAKQRSNLGVSAFYKLDDSSHLYAKALYQIYYDKYDSYNNTATNGTPNAAASTEDRTVRNGVQFGTQRWDRQTDTDTVRLQVGGKHDRDDLRLDYDLSFTATRAKEGQEESNRRVTGTSFATDRSASPALPTVTQLSGPSWSSFEDSTLGILRRLTTNDEDMFVGSVNLRKDFDLAVPAYIKTGLKFSERTKKFDVEWPRWNYVGPDGVAKSADDNLIRFADNGWDDVIFDVYDVIPFHNHQAVRAELEANPEFFSQDLLNGYIQSRRRDYTADEETMAAYILGDVDLGSLSINAGVRFEQTRGKTTSLQEFLNAPDLETRFGTTATGYGKYKNVLPSVHLKYEPADGLLMRASYSNTIGRPPFAELRPRINVDEADLEIVANNPDLKPQTSQNFDASVEYYFEPVGLISAGVFLKEMSNRISRLVTTVGSGPDNGFNGEYAGWDYITRQNTGSARVRGVEVSYQQQFTFLPGWLQGFGGFANFTYQQTRGNFLDTNASVVTTELARFVPRSGNAGISYVAYGYSVRATVNWLDDYLFARNNNANLSQYRFARTTVDLKASYALNRQFSLEASLSNLTNEPINDFLGGVQDRYRRNLDRGRALTFGISGRY